MNYKIIISLILILLAIIAGSIYLYNQSISMESKNNNTQLTIKYLPIGDSYTIGNGVAVEQRWPNLLTSHLQQEGVDIELIGNPAVSGYRVQDAIDAELSKLKQLKPDFVTVLIGANDSFAGLPVSQYLVELNSLLDQIQAELSDPTQIVMITIPDYTISPSTRGYDPRQLSAGQDLIKQYNQVISQVAAERKLGLADIFPISQTMTTDEDYINDGLHPSGSGYQKWEAIILPVVKDKLDERK